MTQKQLRTLITLMIVEILIANIATIQVGVNSGDDITPPGGIATEALGPLSAGMEVRQEVPTSGGAIAAVSLLVATYKRSNSGNAELEIQARQADGSWKTLWIQTVDKSELRDNEPWTIVFSTPLQIGTAQNVSFTLRSAGGPDQSIAWWSNGKLQRDGFQLFQNGRAIPGTAHLTVQFAAPTGPFWRMIPAIWKRLTVFLNPFWQGALLCGIAFLLCAPLLFVRPPPRQ